MDIEKEAKGLYEEIKKDIEKDTPEDIIIEYIESYLKPNLKVFDRKSERINNMSPDIPTNYEALRTMKQAFSIDQLGRGTKGHEIRIGNTVVYFSYDQIVGLETKDGKLYVLNNYWSSTTGGHINSIIGVKGAHRLDAPEFLKVLDDYFI